MMTRPASLRTRIILIVAAVAAAAVIITGAAMIPMARAATIAEARGRVAAQVDLLAEVGAGAALGSRMKSAESTRFAMIRNGRVRGDGASYAVNERVRKALLESGTFSGTVSADAGPALVEARSSIAGVVVGALPMREVETSQGLATRRILLALFFGLALATLAGWLLSLWVARPLRETALSARRLSSGERGVAFPNHGPFEIREVTAALSALDSALTTSESRQREFLLSVSHELRTPLAAIRGYGEALADNFITPDAAGSVGRTLVDETERLDLFVADLLSLARLEADDFRLDVSAFDVRSVVRNAVDAWEGRASILGIRLTATLPEYDVHLRSDPQRVRQVLDGLIENALRATPEGGSVAVTVTATDSSQADSVAKARLKETPTIRLDVADTGSGLTPEELTMAFERGALHTRFHGIRPVGTGLGLSIAARLVSRLSGEITAHPGKTCGTVFVVILPTVSTPAKAA